MPARSRKRVPLGLADVTIADGFWRPRLDVNRQRAIPHIHEMCKRTGRLDALRLQWKPGQPNPPHIFWESDVAKWIEAASYSLATHPDPALNRLLDETVALVAGAQQPDGYLNVHFTLVEPDKRFTNLRDWHELYCAGHLIEAGVAHFRATGKRTLLDVVSRYADCLDRTFGCGKRTGYCGHPEVELALAKLGRATGCARYLRLAEYFINERGRRPNFFDAEARARGEDTARQWAPGGNAYYQAHRPVREQREAVGHAVRAMYLYCGMADVAVETGDASLRAACRRLWRNTTGRKMYVTGGIGARHAGEAFGDDWELPNETAYAETCAAIGLMFFAHRMLQIEADGRYADVMERALYNGVLAGISLDGEKYFYVNPLASAGGHHRQPFFDCACCPTNLVRLLASLGPYVYSAGRDALYVHLYVGGEARAEIAGRRVVLEQRTAYPWEGLAQGRIGLASPATFTVALRVPGWCRRFRVEVNRKRVAAKAVKGYAKVRRRWRDGDIVSIRMDMPVERLVAHPAVADDAGRTAIQRGPLVYCLEQCDHPGAPVRAIALVDGAALEAVWDARLLGGCVTIRGRGLAPAGAGGQGALYRPARAAPKRSTVRIRAIPYFLWDNRQAGAMAVWLPRA